MDTDERGPVLEPLNPSEEEWVQANVAAAIEAGVDLDDPSSVGELFDVELEGWLADAADRREDPNTAVNLVGLTAGEHLRRRCGLEWALATDDAGSEIVLHRESHDVLVYPVGLIAQRWADRAAGAVGPLLTDIAARLAALDD